MPSQLSAFDVPSQSEFFTNPTAYGYTAMPQQYCCAPGTPDGTPGACFGPGSYLTTGARGAGRAGAAVAQLPQCCTWAGSVVGACCCLAIVS